jgi:DNA-directed RNA polymerase subunit RPC12/RpoP/nucleoid DNA-binding protein
MKQSALIEELSKSTDISGRQVGVLLKKLTEIAYREAANGFTIPGICKLRLVRRKPSRYRNPATGKLMQMPERDVLKAILLKKAKDAVIPKSATRPTEVQEEVVDEVLRKKQTVKNPPPSEPKRGVMGDGDVGNIVFECQGCGRMLSAHLDHAGLAVQCPLCSTDTSIPDRKLTASGTEAPADIPSGGTLGSMAESQEDFITFVCQTCTQEIEAPIDMVQMDATCPTCGSDIHVPDSNKLAAPSTPLDPELTQSDAPVPDRNAMTIRMDLSDLN